MDLSVSLLFYKKPFVRDALIYHAQDKEISAVFHGGYFGKRPDVLVYSNDVLELAKKKASSFHCSEELWHNPLSIRTGMKRHELDELRKGWDLILDVDCPDWELSKLTTHLFIKALKHHDVSCVSVKFSGNKGFHIAVPFEAFPKTISVAGEIKEVKDLLPQGPRAVASYLLSFIQRNFITVNQSSKEVIFDSSFTFSFDQLQKIAKLSGKSLFVTICPSCLKSASLPSSLIIYQCHQCGHVSRPKGSPDLIRCEKCSFPVSARKQKYSCSFCSSEKLPVQQVDISSVVEVDTVLIASRHLYRMPFSLHEKSGLASIPIPLDGVLSFNKSFADPKKLSPNVVSIPFLDRSGVTTFEATNLLREAFDHASQNIFSSSPLPKIEIPKEAILKDFFPPCISSLSAPLEDGKKRALFILVNFFRSVGWSKEQITQFIYDWNDDHPEPLREQYLKGQLSQIRSNKKILPPPSCSNKDYYKSLLVCSPDGFCPRIKNPAQYAKRKSELDAPVKKKELEKVVFSSKEDLALLSSSSLVSFLKKLFSSHPFHLEVVGAVRLPCFGRPCVDIFIQSPFIDELSSFLLKNDFLVTRRDDDQIVCQGVYENSSCQLFFIREGSQLVAHFKKIQELLLFDSVFQEEFLLLKKKYLNKTLSSYTRAKHKFFRSKLL
jgi:hypothetical protein